MANYRDAAKERFWRRMMQQYQRSGMTIRAFCELRGLGEHTFHAWRRELAQRDRQAGDHGQEPAAFVPVVVQPQRLAENEAAIEILLGNGRCVRVRPGFDPGTLTRIVTLLEGGRSC